MPSLYRVAFVARTPAASGAPALSEIGQASVTGLTWTDELNRPGAIQFSVAASSLPPAVRTRLANPFYLPVEVIVYRGTAPMKMGFVQGYPVAKGNLLSIYAKGLLGYLEGARVISDYAPTGVDVATIAKTLIDTWQSGTGGNFGLSTANIVALGSTRDATYVGAERPNVLTELQRLRALDIEVEVLAYNDRRVRVYTPTMGTNLSAQVIVDRTNLLEPGVVVSVAPEDVATEAYVSSTSATGPPLVASAVDAVTRLQWGRWATVESYTDISSQTTLQAHADARLATRNRLKLDVGPTFHSRPGCAVTDFEVGDTIGYAYDYGLGLVTATPRVAQRRVSVPDDGGPEIMSVTGA